MKYRSVPVLPNEGDIVVYRERSAYFERDRVRRATFSYADTSGSLFVSRREVTNANLGLYEFKLYRVHQSDVVRVEPTQHGWEA